MNTDQPAPRHLAKAAALLRERGIRGFARACSAFLAYRIRWVRDGLLGAMPEPALAVFAALSKRPEHSSSPAALYARAQRYFFGLFEPSQIPEEFIALLTAAREVRPDVLVEIGTAKGGTLLCWTALAHDTATIVSMDLPDGKFGGGYEKWRIPFFKAFRRAKQRLELLRLDSHAAESVDALRTVLGGKPIDVLFIDGDHSYEGVKKDFESYAPLVRTGGIIAFHDIAPKGVAKKVGGVPVFWREVKERYPHQELVHDAAQDGFGIGYLRV